MPLDVFEKGETCNEILFAKFPEPTALETVLSAFRKKGLTYKGKAVWAKVDQPIGAWAPLKFLIGLKRLLASKGWDFPK